MIDVVLVRLHNIVFVCLQCDIRRWQVQYTYRSVHLHNQGQAGLRQGGG